MSWDLPDVLTLSSPTEHGPSYATRERDSQKIADTLDRCGARCEVERIVVAPQLTRYEVVAAQGTSIRMLPKYASELAYELAAETVRVIAPIPGKRAIGIDVPNRERRIVRAGDVAIEACSPMRFGLGVDVEGELISCDMRAMPHVLVAGTTGGGKSTLINSMLCQLLSVATPDDLGLVLIDPKQVELTPYEGIPHLLGPIVTDPIKAVDALHGLVEEMEMRYDLAARVGARSLDELNVATGGRPLSYLLCVIDELADLMMVAGKEVEDSICRIAQKARAVGIHLLLATQSPRVSVITGMIKANMPARACFQVAQSIDSRVVLDTNGGEALLGQGDMLWLPPGASAAQRLQSAYVETSEIRATVEHWRAQVAQREAVAA